MFSQKNREKKVSLSRQPSQPIYHRTRRHHQLRKWVPILAKLRVWSASSRVGVPLPLEREGTSGEFANYNRAQLYCAPRLAIWPPLPRSRNKARIRLLFGSNTSRAEKIGNQSCTCEQPYCAPVLATWLRRAHKKSGLRLRGGIS